MHDNFELYMDSLKYIFACITIGVQLEYGFTKISLPMFARITIEVQLGLKYGELDAWGLSRIQMGVDVLGLEMNHTITK